MLLKSTIASQVFKKGEIKVVASRSSSAFIIQSDLLATNGIIHIIDAFIYILIKFLLFLPQTQSFTFFRALKVDYCTVNRCLLPFNGCIKIEKRQLKMYSYDKSIWAVFRFMM